MTETDQILAILQREIDIELSIAKKAKKMMKETLNPVMHWRLRKLKNTSIDHAVGIQLAKILIQKELD